MIAPLHGVVRNYAWGSHSAIPEFIGVPATGEPWAELWFGAHPSGPAGVGAPAEPLDRLIAADPAAVLGSQTARRFGGRLPFLVKLLASVEPLSLQAHPSAAQAQAGFAAEEARQIPLDAPQRMFRDPWHKPEMICALSPFKALCGLRDPAATAELLDTLDTEALDPVRAGLSDGSTAAMRETLRWLLELPSDAARTLVSEVIRCCAERNIDDEWADFSCEIARLGGFYRSDPGVVVALLLNYVRLQPGEALVLAPGRLHCYLEGFALEVMAASDNVVRGGLTSKHVDVETLMAVLDVTAGPAEVQRPGVVNGVAQYRSDVEEFSLQRCEVDGTLTVDGGPAVVVCTDGHLNAAGVALRRGSAAFADAGTGSLRLEGRATLYLCGVGEPSEPL